MKTLALALGSVALLAGCASSPALPYAPMQQPPGAKISAAYQIAGDTLRIEVDTDHRRLEEARIVKADGTDVRPFNIDNPPLVTQPSGSSIGFGIGGVSGGGGSAVGSGIGINAPVGGSPPQPSRVTPSSRSSCHRRARRPGACSYASPAFHP
jgi:hypothetical protein